MLAVRLMPTCKGKDDPGLLQLFVGDQNVGDRLTRQHLHHQGFEQIEAMEQGPTFRADHTLQIRNHDSARHRPSATKKN